MEQTSSSTLERIHLAAKAEFLDIKRHPCAIL